MRMATETRARRDTIPRIKDKGKKARSGGRGIERGLEVAQHRRQLTLVLTTSLGAIITVIDAKDMLDRLAEENPKGVKVRRHLEHGVGRNHFVRWG